MKRYIQTFAIALTLGGLLVANNSFAQKHHHNNGNGHHNKHQNHHNGHYNDHHNNHTNYYHNDARHVRTTTTYSPGYTYSRNKHRTYNTCATTNRLRILPRGCETVCHNNINYYRNGSTYYSYNNGYYEIVRAPMNSRISYLPQGAYSVWQNGRNVYVSNNTFYEPFVNRNGLVRYRVIGYSY